MQSSSFKRFQIILLYTLNDWTVYNSNTLNTVLYIKSFIVVLIGFSLKQ